MPGDQVEAMEKLEELVGGNLKMGIHLSFANLFVNQKTHCQLIDIITHHSGVKKECEDEEKNPLIFSTFGSKENLPSLKDAIDKVSPSRRSGQQGTSLRDPFTVKHQSLKLIFKGTTESREVADDIVSVMSMMVIRCKNVTRNSEMIP